MDDRFGWHSRVRQELDEAVAAVDRTARTAHFELALLHLEADGLSDQQGDRDRLHTALFARLAFAEGVDRADPACIPTSRTIEEGIEG